MLYTANGRSVIILMNYRGYSVNFATPGYHYPVFFHIEHLILCFYTYSRTYEQVQTPAVLVHWLACWLFSQPAADATPAMER